jgi:hypothetical protein
MILRCTKKLRDELKVDRKELLGSEPGPAALDEWFCDLLRIERQKYVLCTHARTLFSVVLPQVRRADLVHLPTMLAGTVAGAMETEGFAAPAIESVVSLHEVRYGLTNSRSVLGSMNDISFQYLIDVELYGDAGRLRGLIGKRLNRNPLSAIGYRYAIDVMRGEVSLDRH